MMCKGKRSNMFWAVVALVSVTVGLLGWIIHTQLPESAHGLSALMGMFSGMGAGFTLVAVFFMIRGRFLSPEKKRIEEIEEKDERHVQVLNAAFRIASLTGTALFVVLAACCLFVQQFVLAYICVGAIWVQQIVFLVAYKALDKRM